jgi:protein Tex
VLPTIADRIATEIAAQASQVNAAVELLDGGATVPFIARYRKEATGGLDDIQLRALEERLGYLRELEDRRVAVLKSIDEQGKLTDTLEREVLDAETKIRLEDIYLPYKPKRRTKAQIAREAGLSPLSEAILADPSSDPHVLAVPYVNESLGFGDVKSVLDGARQILMEEWADDAQLSGQVRDWLWDNARITSTLVPGKENDGAKFADYFEFVQPIKNIPSHRALALFRARNEGIVHLELVIDDDEAGRSRPERMIAHRFAIRDDGRLGDAWIRDCVRFTWRVKLFTRLDLELKSRMRDASEIEAIKVFASNMRDLLLAAPAGRKAAIGLDPGLRTGVKVAVVDGTGKVVATDTIYPHPPRKLWDESIVCLAKLARQHGVSLVAVGNGTASRETDKLAAELAKIHPELRLSKVMVSEAGASVYSASALASSELPDLDVSLRGAVSIARRLQDPLAELVKIDPKSIGVGQYQHDVSQFQLARSLDNVVEDCVNAVGVDVNTASPALLTRVAGLSSVVADNIVAFRNERGAFPDRRSLKGVPRLGDKTFEQAAGFLRVLDGTNALDASAVHPEAYPVVKKVMQHNRREITQIIGDASFLGTLNPADYVSETFGLPTVQDIIKELEKPGRDPRPQFKTAEFRDGVEKVSDLKPSMVLEAVVTNVTNFGAFVDVGVHQDGLVHISAMSDKFVKDPHQIVKTGEVVKVKVMDVDVKRNRISLTMRLDDEPGRAGKSASNKRDEQSRRPASKSQAKPQDNAPSASGTMAAAFRNARRN